jgi:hypothetical protein
VNPVITINIAYSSVLSAWYVQYTVLTTVSSELVGKSGGNEGAKSERTEGRTIK